MDLDIFRKNFLNIIIVIVIVIIIIAAYGFLSNPQEPVEIYYPDEVVENSDEYLNEKITVEGYYYNENRPEGEGVISKSILTEGSSSSVVIITLPVDHSNVNTSGLLIDEIKYRFTGTLIEKESEYGKPVILIAEKIEQV